MKLGIGSYTFTWAIGVPGHPPRKPMTCMDLLLEAARLGVEVVQICDNLAPERMTDDECSRLADRAHALGLTIEVGARGIGDSYLRSCLHAARRLGSRLLRVVVDSPGDEPSAEECAARLRRMRHDFTEAGVLLAIENHDRYPCSELAALVSDLGDDWVGICLDTVNSFGALEGPGVVMDALAPHCLSLHLKDFIIRRADHGMGFIIEGAPCGEGRLDVPGILETLRRAGRDPNAVIELWTPPASDLTATIARERLWAEQSVANVRQYLPRTISPLDR